MTLKQRPAVSPVRPEAARSARKRSGLGALLLVAIGTLLLCLPIANVLADVGQSGGNDALRATDGNEQLTGQDGDDRISGLDGDDELYGGGGRDLLLGGPGADFIEAKDGEEDFVDCGPGNDVASVDPADRVEGNCETLYPG